MDSFELVVTPKMSKFKNIIKKMNCLYAELYDKENENKNKRYKYIFCFACIKFHTLWVALLYKFENHRDEETQK